MVDQEKAILNPQQTAQAILVQVTDHPDTLDMNNWEDEIGCRTTRCIGGWARYLHEGKVSTFSDVESKAQEYLGLDEDDAENLFHQTTNRQAIKALQFLAAGKSIDWNVVWAANPEY